MTSSAVNTANVLCVSNPLDMSRVYAMANTACVIPLQSQRDRPVGAIVRENMSRNGATRASQPKGAIALRVAATHPQMAPAWVNANLGIKAFAVWARLRATPAIVRLEGFLGAKDRSGFIRHYTALESRPARLKLAAVSERVLSASTTDLAFHSDSIKQTAFGVGGDSHF